MDIDAGPGDTGTREEGTTPFSRPLNFHSLLASYDVAIVGGGVIGSSVAYYLAQHPLRVCLLEAGEIGSGASGAGDGFLSLQSKEPGPLLETAKASLELFRTLPADVVEMVEFAACGGMILARDRASLDSICQVASRATHQGLQVDLLSPAEALELEPALAPVLAGASLCNAESQVNPLNLTLALARSAAQGGASVVENCPVTALSHEAGSWCLTTSAGVLRAERVVCCAGAWSPVICEQLGARIPVYPLKGQVLVTEYTGPLFTHTLAGAEYLASKHTVRGRAKSASTYSSGFTAEWTHSGNILLGSTREDAGYDRSTTPEALRSIAELATIYVPSLERLGVIRSYAGLRPQSDDGMPLVGEIPGRPGFWLATGHGGDGIALSLETGRLVAEGLLHNRELEELRPFSPARFRT